MKICWVFLFFLKSNYEKEIGIDCLALGSGKNGRDKDHSCQKNSMTFWHLLLLLIYIFYK